MIKSEYMELRDPEHAGHHYHYGLNLTDHIPHCFDYIRQALMCAGDLTLEWPRTEKNGQRFAVDGWGVPHQCKSWVCQQLVILVVVLTVRNRKPSQTT